jgi:crotonobetainyl-CoA:carnitine CoA-transferase CaiB-like acyl-CoA transferase
MVRTADVVIANLPAATLQSMGLDYDTLCTYRKDIIFVTNTAFGPVGPMSANVGFDGIGQVMCGATYMTGTIDQPYRASAPYVDFGTALHCAFGTMAALMERQQTGKGQIVTGALLATALTINNASLIEQAVVAPHRKPTGNRGQTAAPSDIYKTRDGWVLVAVTGNPLYKRWAKLMGEPEWLTDPRFATDDDRGAHAEIISERMGRWCAERATDDIVKILGDAKIPSAPVLTPQQALDHPQVQALGVLQDTDYPGLPRPAPVAAVPIWMTETQAVPRRRPPLLGEHTDEVLTELGYSAQDIQGLRDQGVI